MPPLGLTKYIKQAAEGRLPLDECVSALQEVGVLTDFDLFLQTDILSQTPAALHPYIRQLRLIVLDHYAVTGPTAPNLQKATPEHPISSGITALDSLLLGGLHFGHTTEICGKPGVGKSFMAMSFAAHHLLPHHATDHTHKVYFVHTGAFSVWRAQQALQARLRNLGKETTEAALQRAMEHFVTVNCTTIDALLAFLYKFADARSAADKKSHSSCDLLVIDSIRPLLVSELQKDVHMSVHIHAVLTAIRHLCRLVHAPCAVLITNGVSFREQKDGTIGVNPSLGFSWGQASHTHILLDQGDTQNEDSRGTRVIATVLKSPIVAVGDHISFTLPVNTD